MKPEQLLWLLIKPYIPGFRERVENAAAVGTPDVHWTYESKTSWLELKVAKHEGQQLEEMFKPSQKVWHAKAISERGRVFVLMRDGPTLVLYRATYKSKVDCAYTPEWASTKPWKWAEFEDIIRSL